MARPGSRTIASRNKFGVQPLRLTVGVDKRDERAIASVLVDLDVTDAEANVAAVCQPARNQIDEHLMLRVHSDSPTREPFEVDATPLTGEPDLGTGVAMTFRE